MPPHEGLDRREVALDDGLGGESLDLLGIVADAGMLMPPKSTWFEPKLRSGLFTYLI